MTRAATTIAFCLVIYTLISGFYRPRSIQARVPETPRGGSTPVPNPNRSWLDQVDARWGGHIKLRGSVSWPAEESLFRSVDAGPYWDGYTEGRFMNSMYVGKSNKLDTHYEVVLSGGDSWDNKQEAQSGFGNMVPERLLASRVPRDDRRLMDLSTDLIDEDGHILLYHRLDRLVLTLKPDWGTLRIGRQAVTWGNGLLFNPLDLFNPFEPTDIERDYKTGDDLVSARFSLLDAGSLHLLYVPRRDISSNQVQWDESSVTAKLHVALGTTEFDVMAAKHYQDQVLGLGSVGYVGSAAWRFDATWTFLDGDSPSDDYLSLVANMDYSWVWYGKNLYGYVEYFYNGLGKDDYADALASTDLIERVDRGELFTLGRCYLSGHLRVELHPLIHILITAINNFQDPSGILQARVTWDVTQDTQVLVGHNLYHGRRDTEFGGINIPGIGFTTQAPATAFVWLNYYF